MNTLPVSAQYEQLPEIYKKEADDFISFLYSKFVKQDSFRKPLKRNGFGSLKGKIKMTDDFDAPLEEFKEYM